MKLKLTPPGPKARAIVNKTKKFCIDTTFAYPLVIKDGKGCHIQDIDGNWYLDFNSNVASCNVGYKHPEIMKILREYSRISPHKIAGQDFYSEEQARLAEKLVKITPKNLTRVFLINTGTEAVENAMKFAYRRRGSLPGISCIGAFHGRTIGSLTFTFSKPVHKKNYPQVEHKRIEFCMKDNDPHIDDLEKILERDSNVAFVIIEVVQGEGGYRVASKKFIKTIRKVTRKYGIPLIIDEVQSGMGRTGRWWGFENYGVKPDIMAVAKSLQVGATISSEEYDPKERGAVSSTWGGGARIDLAVGLKTIEIIEKEKLMDNARKMGKYALKLFNELMKKYPEKIIDVRGLGLMIGVEFSNKEQRDFVEQDAFKHGLLLLGCGDKTIRIAPPLIIKKDEIEKGVQIFENSLKKA